MKKIFFAAAALLLLNSAFAQKINIQEVNQVIDDITRTGQAVIIDADDRDVEKAWKKRLKDFGKVSSSGNTYTVEGAEIKGVTSNPGQVYSIVEEEKDGVKVFWAIDLGTEFVTRQRTSGAYNNAEQVLYDFAVVMYREKINEEIKDAEKALSKTVKDYEDVIDEGEDLSDDLEDNKEEKEELEQALKDNAAEKKEIEKDIARNQKRQEAQKEEVDKMRKAVEVIKAKLDQIGK